jgi:hypothetical protein
VRKGLIAFVAFVVGCASASPPPGGPEDKMPPKLLKITPDTNAVNVRDQNASFIFDETINDRGTGDQELDTYFLVSPSDGAPHISWHRSHIDVRPRRGFRPNTAYTITLLPGLTDLRGNRMKGGGSVVFSTGPTIPAERIKGIAFDWVNERPAPLAYIEARSPDSVVYLAQADTLGRFTIGPLSAGSYLVRAIMDLNNNRGLDRNEPYDSLRVTVPVTDQIELLAAPRDTLPARILTVAVTDSTRLTVTFDRLLDPRQTVAADAFRLVAADSTLVPILAVLTARDVKRADSVSAAALADSARRADSLAGKPVAPIVRPSPPRTGAGAPPAPPARPSVPAPSTMLTLRLAKPLATNAAYRLSLTAIRALSGRVTASERSFTTPKPPPPKPAPKDSTAAAPGAPRRPPAGAPPVSTPPATPPKTPPAHR